VVFVVSLGAMLNYGLRQYRLFVARLVRDHGIELESSTRDDVSSR
jgi:hypothetical protein